GRCRKLGFAVAGYCEQVLVAVALSGVRVGPIGVGRAHQRGEPTVACGELAREAGREREVALAVVADRVLVIAASGCEEAVAAAVVELDAPLIPNVAGDRMAAALEVRGKRVRGA